MAMQPSEKFRQAADLMFDNWVIRHGPTEYVRDYDVTVAVVAAKPDGDGSYVQGHHRIRFSHCPTAAMEMRLAPAVWRQSWTDDMIEWDAWRAAGEPEGFVWAQGAIAYPGLSYVEDSADALDWSHRLGHPMHELLLETNAYRLRLVFHDLDLVQIARGDPETGAIEPVEPAG